MDTATPAVLFGIAIAVIFGLIGVRAVRKNRLRQQQDTRTGSTAIQSGHDTNIQGRESEFSEAECYGKFACHSERPRSVVHQGLTPGQMKEILDIFAGQTTAYAAVARETVDSRLKEFENRVLERFTSAAAENGQTPAEPDFQYALTRAQHAYARSGDRELLETLVDIIDQRSKQMQRNRLTLTLNVSLETVAELTNNEFADSPLLFSCYSRNLRIVN